MHSYHPAKPRNLLRTALALCGAALAVATTITATTAAAQDFPSKLIRMVAPFPPGGPADVLARPLAESMQVLLGQPVIVEFKPGAGAISAVQMLQGSPADGHTIMMGSNVVALAMGLFKKLPYDTLRDLRGIAGVTSSPYMLLVPAGYAASNLNDLIRAAKAAPGKLNYASSGPGTLAHVTAELFNESAGVKIAHIPYKGGGPALTALMAGEVQVFFDAPFSAQQHIRSGRLKPLALAGASRLESFPDVPTAEEQGLKNFRVASWFGIFALRATPDAVVAKLNDAVNKALQSTVVKERYATVGAVPTGGSAATLQKLVEDEIATWGRVTRNAGISLD